jgi:hypothetical protein
MHVLNMDKQLPMPKPRPWYFACLCYPTTESFRCETGPGQAIFPAESLYIHAAVRTRGYLCTTAVARELQAPDALAERLAR